MFGHHSHNYILTLRTEEREQLKFILLLHRALHQIEFPMNDKQSQKLFIDPKCHRPFETLIGTHTEKNDIFKLQKMQINQTKNRADFKSPCALAYDLTPFRYWRD